MTQTVICCKWEDRYGPEYVNRLYAMVSRNTTRPLRFVCFTDDPTGIVGGVDIKPMPEFTLPEVMRRHPFRRMFIFQERLEDLSGHVLYLDVDLLVTGSIDELFDYAPEHPFCVAENWTQKGKGIGNMSVFRYEIGRHAHVYALFIADPMAQMRKHRNSQTFVCRNVASVKFFTPSWCLSFKHSILPRWPLNFFVTPTLPPDAKIVAFTGRPDIDEARDGWSDPRWYKKIYKHVPPTPWIAEHWR